ncbi:hypothetical protein K438DRAFT_342033 [Mycena galopus ATCC 62051]|nr:hypothetical protein K438DRAFT_342033 [Mycena galopus ATCC 62051]
MRQTPLTVISTARGGAMLGAAPTRESVAGGYRTERYREFREAQDKDRDSAESVEGDSDSASTNKRPNRGARKGKYLSQSPSSPKDETLEALAIASQALAREISRASRAV